MPSVVLVGHVPIRNAGRLPIALFFGIGNRAIRLEDRPLKAALNTVIWR
jgi:hypothetical protein